MLYVACALFAGGLMALITLWTIEFFNREKIMAKNTKAGIDENLSSPFFTKRLEEAKRMVESDEKAKAAYHLLKHMNLSSHENDPSLFSHIPNRQLAELLGIGKSTVFNIGRGAFSALADPVAPPHQDGARVSHQAYPSKAPSTETYYYGHSEDIGSPGFYQDPAPAAPSLVRRKQVGTWASLKRVPR